MGLVGGFVGTTLLIAGLAKIGRTVQTVDFLASVGVRRKLAEAAAPLAPLAEVTVGLALVLGVLTIVSASAAAGLAALFIWLQIAASRRSSVGRCNCFGTVTAIEGKGTAIVRTGVFAVMVGLLVALAALGEQRSLSTVHFAVRESVAGAASATAFILGSSLVAAVRWARVSTVLHGMAPDEVDLA